MFSNLKEKWFITVQLAELKSFLFLFFLWKYGDIYAQLSPKYQDIKIFDCIWFQRIFICNSLCLRSST